MRRWSLLVLVAGCGPHFVKLDTARVRKVEVALVGGGSAFCSEPDLRALVTYLDHSTVQTPSREQPRGTLRPRELRWASDVGLVDANAHLHLPDLQQWHDRQLSITVSVPGRPEVADRIVISPRFDCDGRANHDADSGRRGRDGRHGRSIEVALGYVDTQLNGRLVLARVVEPGLWPEYYLIDRRGPSAAHFVISARGGAGGAGIDGRDGSSGSDGTNGSSGSSGGTCEDGRDGSDGSDGSDGGDGTDGGEGGNGGEGGHVIVSYPAQYPSSRAPSRSTCVAAMVVAADAAVLVVAVARAAAAARAVRVARRPHPTARRASRAADATAAMAATVAPARRAVMARVVMTVRPERSASVQRPSTSCSPTRSRAAGQSRASGRLRFHGGNIRPKTGH